MIKIGIDGNEANTDKPVGIGQYAYKLLENLYFLEPKNNISFRIYLKNKPVRKFWPEKNTWSYKIFGPSKLWTQLALPVKLFFETEKNQIFFSPTHYIPRYAPYPRAVSIMDLSYIYFPQMFKKNDLWQLRNWTAYSIRKAAKIFTISNYSKQAIIEYYKVHPDKIVVTYPGYDEKSYYFKIREFPKRYKHLLSDYHLPDNYLLFVGTIQPRKNIKGLISAFEILKQKKEYRNLNMFIIGKKGWLYQDLFKDLEKSGLKSNIFFLDYVKPTDMPIFYKGALSLILPSLYEGFGLPAIEAMACGSPVVVSNVSSLPEIAGNAGVIVDPYDINSIAGGIEKVISDKSYRQKLINEGLKQVQKYSWQACAQKTLETLVSLIKT